MWQLDKLRRGLNNNEIKGMLTQAVVSVIISAFVAALAWRFGLSDFTCVMIGTVFCIMCGIVAILQKHGKNILLQSSYMNSIDNKMSSLEKSLRDICKFQLKEIEDNGIPLSVATNFVAVNQKYPLENGSISKLYERKLEQLNRELIAHCNGVWATVKASELRQYINFFLDAFNDTDEAYYYAFAEYAELEWFSSPAGSHYFKNVHNNKKLEKNKTRRLFVIDNSYLSDERCLKQNIFFRLHTNNTSEIKTIAKNELMTIFEKNDISDPVYVGICGKKAMFKYIQDDESPKGQFTANAIEITKYTNAFNDAWTDKSTKKPTVPNEIKTCVTDCCRNKKLADLAGAFKMAEQYTHASSSKENIKKNR
jgi:hypothetical protein